MSVLDAEMVALLSNAATEIEALRRQVDALAHRAQGFDALCALIGALVPQRGRGESVDVAWLLRRRADQMREDAADAARAAAEAKAAADLAVQVAEPAPAVDRSVVMLLTSRNVLDASSLPELPTAKGLRRLMIHLDVEHAAILEIWDVVRVGLDNPAIDGTYTVVERTYGDVAVLTLLEFTGREDPPASAEDEHAAVKSIADAIVDADSGAIWMFDDGVVDLVSLQEWASSRGHRRHRVKLRAPKPIVGLLPGKIINLGATWDRDGSAFEFEGYYRPTGVDELWLQLGEPPDDTDFPARAG